MVTEVINRFLPDDRFACRTIEVTVATTIVCLWAFVWWPGAIIVAVLAVLVWSA